LNKISKTESDSIRAVIKEMLVDWAFIPLSQVLRTCDSLWQTGRCLRITSAAYTGRSWNSRSIGIRMTV
jgi:hypothetical protein